MRVFDVAFEPKIYFSLNSTEIDMLMECAKCHYDWACRTTAIPGQGAFLYGASQSDGHFSVTIRQLDTLCKIVEMPPPLIFLGDLPDFFHSMMKQAKDITPDLTEGLTYGEERKETTSKCNSSNA